MEDIVTALQDMRHLCWNERTVTSGTSGTFPKARRSGKGCTYYYKLSCYDSYRGVYGHECVNELIAARLMRHLGIPCADYRLVHALVTLDDTEYDTWMNVSTSFRTAEERKMAFDLFYDLEREHRESPFEVCQRMGWAHDIALLLLIDYLIVNRDRHGANIEVIRQADGAMRLVPLFDNGLSFVFSSYNDASRAAAFNELEDVNANNFLGTRSLEDNLRFVPELVPVPVVLPPLDEAALDHVLFQLEDALPEAHRSKIRSILRLRWAHLVEEGLVEEAHVAAQQEGRALHARL